jgi:hypothetical protein
MPKFPDHAVQLIGQDSNNKEYGGQSPPFFCGAIVCCKYIFAGGMGDARRRRQVHVCAMNFQTKVKTKTDKSKKDDASDGLEPAGE